jgi:hypothetical protein
MLKSLIKLPPELHLQALKIIAKTEGLSGLKSICETNKYFSELCKINKDILIKEVDGPRLEKLFKYISINGAKGIQEQETESFCERNYEIINQKLDEYLVNNPQTRANVFEIYVELSEDEYDREMDFIVPDAVQEAFDNWGYRYFMRRGDILFNSVHYRYRNDGKCLFDGEKLVGLEADFNEYGHVSREFLAFTEFPPDYWEDFAYNGVIVAWVDFSELDILRTYRRDDMTVCEVEWDNKIYKLITEEEDEPEGIVLIWNDVDEFGENEYKVEI